MIAKIKPFVIGGVIVIAAGGILYKKVYLPKQTQSVPVYAEQKKGETINGIGTLEAKEVVVLAPKTTSRIEAISADEGDAVKRNQIVVSMEASELHANVRESNALIAKSRSQRLAQQALIEDLEAKYTLADTTLKRYAALLKGGFVTQAEFDTAQALERSAKAQCNSAKENLALSAHDIEKSEAILAAQRAKMDDLALRSPFDGVVISRNAEAGSTVGAGVAVVRIADPKTLWVKIYIDEAQSSEVKIGQKATVILRSRPKQTFSGEVVRVGVESDRVTEERIVYLKLSDTPESFHIGEQAEATISLSQSDTRR